MLGRVVVENGVKKIVPLTADCGSGNPVGTVIAVYSNKVPNGYLPCNGVAFDTAQFPVLYALLGDDHTPDLRECTLVGIGQSDRTMGAHDVYTIGQFKDDQLQNITGSLEAFNDKGWLPPTDYSGTGAVSPIEEVGVYGSGEGTNSEKHTIGFDLDASRVARAGTTTHGKQVGVNWCIKATSGINENQADNVLSALSPVDVVALNNVHSVTSNAVYNETKNISTADIAITYHSYRMYFRKVGKVVSFSLYGDFRNLPVTSDWVSIGNIPQGYRPNTVLLFREQTSLNFTIKMKTDGVIELFNYMSQSYSIVNGFFNGSWIVD